MFIVLVGPKGSGKSHVGRLLESAFGVHFLAVEPLWMAYHDDCRRSGRAPSIDEGIARVRPAIEAALARHAEVCVETTGASPEIFADLLSLAPAHQIRLVRIEAPLSICLDRVRRRDPTQQIPTDERTIARVHELSSKLAATFDLEIHNVALPDERVVALFAPMLASRTEPAKEEPPCSTTPR